MKAVKHLVRGVLIWWGLAGSALAVEEYCQLVAVGLLPGNVKIMVDYGTHPRGHHEPIMDESTGRPMRFGSVIGALNYMASKGWSLVTTYPLSNATGGGKTYHFLMVRGSPSSGPVVRADAPTTSSVATATARQLYQALGRTPDLISDEWKRDTKAVEALLDEGERPSSLLRAAQAAAGDAAAAESLAEVLSRGLEMLKTSQ
jgi:hypothetical protein